MFNPWTGFFGNTLYSSHKKEEEIEEIKHKSFKMTKGHSGWLS